MATNKERYSVLSYNVNGYEVIHPVEVKSDRARYIMVTDDPNLVDESGTWEVVYDNTLTGSTFDKCYQIRFNPFKYTDDNIVLRIDGSVGIIANLDPLIDKFTDGGYDLSLMVHPTRNTQYEEYLAWVNGRGYDAQQANKVLAFMQMAEGYNVKEWKGLCQLCYIIQRRNRVNDDINRMTYTMLKYLGNNTDEIERVDQTVFSFVVQKYFGNANIMWVDQRMYNGKPDNAPFQWYPHHSYTPFPPMDVKLMKEPYWMNKRLHNTIRPKDL